jgi:hypothetical protein
MADDEDLVRRLTKAFGVQPRHLGSVPHGPLGLLHAVGLAEKQKLLRLRLDRSDVDAIRRFPPYIVHQLIKCGPGLASAPTAVFRGLRVTGEPRIRSGWAVVGRPSARYDNSGRALPAPKGMVFAVFADADGLVFDWDWIESDPKDPLLPEASPDRFSRRVPTPRIELELGGLAPGKFTGGFASHSWVGDCVFTYVSDKPAYAKRVDAKLTVFRDFVRHTAVGFKLKDAASVRGSIEGSTSVSRLLVAAAHLTGENEHLADFLPRFGGLTAVEWHSDMTNPRASSGGHAMRAPE